MLGLRSESDKFLHLDCLRVVATLGVVAYHAAGYSGWRIALPDLRYLVDLFFVISGFVIAFVYADRLPGAYNTFLANRIARIVPLHWLTLAIMAGLALIGGATGPAFDFHCLVPNALAIHAFGMCRSDTFNGPSWSISGELAMYVLAPLLLAFARKPKLVEIATLAALALLVIGVDWSAWTYQAGAVRALPSFLFGAGLFFRRDWVARIPSTAWTVAAALLLFMVSTVCELGSAACILATYLIATVAVAADLRGAVPSLTRKLAPVSQLSFAVYMLHVPLLTAMASRPALAHLGLTRWAGLLIVTAVITVWPIAWLVHMSFERPLRNMMRRRLGARKTRHRMSVVDMDAGPRTAVALDQPPVGVIGA